MHARQRRACSQRYIRTGGQSKPSWLAVSWTYSNRNWLSGSASSTGGLIVLIAPVIVCIIIIIIDLFSARRQWHNNDYKSIRSCQRCRTYGSMNRPPVTMLNVTNNNAKEIRNKQQKIIKGHNVSSSIRFDVGCLYYQRQVAMAIGKVGPRPYHFVRSLPQALSGPHLPCAGPGAVEKMGPLPSGVLLKI